MPGDTGRRRADGCYRINDVAGGRGALDVEKVDDDNKGHAAAAAVEAGECWDPPLSALNQDHLKLNQILTRNEMTRYLLITVDTYY